LRTESLFNDAAQEDFSLNLGSLAIGGGKDAAEPVLDYVLNLYNTPRSIGAYEGNPASAVHDLSKSIQPIPVYPNPTSGTFSIAIPEMIFGDITISIINTTGQVLKKFELQTTTSDLVDFNPGRLVPGLYYVVIQAKSGTFHASIIIE